MTISQRCTSHPLMIDSQIIRSWKSWAHWNSNTQESAIFLWMGNQRMKNHRIGQKDSELLSSWACIQRWNDDNVMELFYLEVLSMGFLRRLWPISHIVYLIMWLENLTVRNQQGNTNIHLLGNLAQFSIDRCLTFITIRWYQFYSTRRIRFQCHRRFWHRFRLRGGGRSM